MSQEEKRGFRTGNENHRYETSFYIPMQINLMYMASMKYDGSV